MSLAAVAATVVATFALAGPASAAPATDVTMAAPSSATIDPGTGTAAANESTFTPTTTAGGDIAIEVSQTVPAQGDDPLTVTEGTITGGGTPAWSGSISKSWSADGTTVYYDLYATGVAAGGTAPITVSSTYSGTVTVEAGGYSSTGLASGRLGSTGSTALVTQPAVPQTPTVSKTVAVKTPTTVTLSAPKDQSAFANTAASYTVTAKDSDGDAMVAGTRLHVTASETPASGQAEGPDLYINDVKTAGGDNGASNPTATTTTATAVVTVSGSDGQATFSIKSSQVGTVNISVAADDNGSASTTVGDTGTLTVVASSGAAADNVTTLAATPASVKQYTVDGDGTNSGVVTYTVTATGANGVAVNGVQVMYETISGSTTSAPATFGDLTASGGKVKSTISESTAGSGTVKFWVNYTLANGGATNGPDSGEPTTSSTYQIDAAPTTTGATVKVTGANTAGTQLPTGAQTLSVTVNVKNNSDNVSGASVGLDVDLNGAPSGTTNPVRYTAVTDADGNATFSVPVTSVEAASGKTVTLTPYISESSTVGSGTAGTAKTYTFTTPAVTTVTPSGATTVDNMPGGTVTVPVTVTDQYGKPFGAGQAVVYNITGGNGNDASGQVATINSSGEATVTYTDKSGQTDYSQLNDETITFTNVAGQSSTLPGNVTVDYVKSTVPGSLTDTSTYTGTFDLTPTVSKTDNQELDFTLKDADGTTLAGQPVTVTVDNGFIGTSNSVDSTAGKSVTAITGSTGVAQVWVGSAQSGSQTATATAGSQTVTSKTITYSADTATKTTLTGPSEIAAGAQGTFKATVADDLGNGVPGVPVTFTATDPSVLPGATSPLTVVTGPDGTASVTITEPADTTSTGNTITATATGTSAPASPDNTASATYTVGTAVSKVKVDGIKGVGVGGTEKIAVRVWNADGSLASGAVVNIKVTGANKASGTATTGANGELGWFPYTAKNAGTDHVTATIGGKTASTTVTITSAVSAHLFHPVAQANGTFLFSVQTVPATKGARVNLFAVYHPGRSDEALFHAGNGTTNANGRVVKATSPGYLVHGKFKHYRAGQTYVLVAKVVGSAGQSAMRNATAK